MPIQSRNPYNQEILGEFDELSNAQIRSAINKAGRTFLSWKQTSFSKRSELMLKLANLLEKNQEALARIISLEMGKIIVESRAEIKKCAWVCRYYAEHAEKFLKDEKLNVPEVNSFITYDPIGIVLAIMPWNFPFWQVFRFSAPGIMAGNVGLLKHASNVPQCALAIEDLFLKAGFPDGVFQTLLIGSSKVNDIIDDFRIRAITLTGSDIAGRKVAERAGKNLKKLVLELGGSDPFIVLKDANLDEAVHTGVKARMINCGQSCIAAKRFIVEEAVSDIFLEKYVGQFNKLKGGDPLDENSDFGPIAREDLYDELRHQVSASMELGAVRLTKDSIISPFGPFYPPTVLSNISPGMPGFDEELFGPVASVIIVKDEHHAIKIANQSRFGLGASIWTRDIKKACRFAKEIETGSVFINAMVASHPMVPFGGIKDSGYGRELSSVGIKEFMNLKSVWINP